jgi:FKBP-type peptidyl-prolyl cis-trans isomerase 2
VKTVLKGTGTIYLNSLDYLVLKMVEKGDFILLELEGKDQEGRVFDSTKGEVAKKLHGKEGPLLVVFGMDRLIPGIYDALMGMKQGEEKSIHLNSDQAFGDRKKDLVKIMSSAEFARHKVNPEPGLVIHVDTDTGRLYGTVKSVTGGRVMVDFNHPIAGQEVDYSIKLLNIYTTPEEKVKELMGYLELEGDFKLSNEGELSLKLRKKEGQEYELHKAMLLVTAKSKIAGIKKVDLKEE